MPEKFPKFTFSLARGASIFTFSLALVAALLLVFLLLRIRGSQALKSLQCAARPPAVTSVVSQSETAPALNAEAEDKSGWGRDPFSGTVYALPGESEGRVRIEGILWDATAPMAMIDGAVVQPGDLVSGQRVVSIRSDRVILDDGNKEYEVLMQEQ